MSRAGTLVICLPHLEITGGNLIVFNMVKAKLHAGPVVVLSPTLGQYATQYHAIGAAVRIGTDITDILSMRNIFCILCSSVSLAPTVLELSPR
jgi:hypothetical protein